MTDPGHSGSPATEALAAWAAGDELSDLEALMWRAEDDARLRSDIVTLYLLDRAPDWERLRAIHAAHVRAVREPGLCGLLPASSSPPRLRRPPATSRPFAKAISSRTASAR